MAWPWIYRRSWYNTAPRLVPKHYNWHVCAEDTLEVLIPTTPSQRQDLPERFDNVLWWNESIPGASFRYLDSSVKEKTGVFRWTPGIGDIHDQPWRFSASTTAADTCSCYQVNSRTFLVYVHEKPSTHRRYDSFSCGGFNAAALDTITIPGTWQYEWKLQSLDAMHTFDRQTGKDVRLQAPKGGTYRVQLLSRGPENVACPARYVDTVTIDSFVAVSLPNDTAYCQNEAIHINSQLIEGQPISYRWSTGDTATTSILLSLTQDTLIKLKISDSAGCKNEASMRIKMHALPQFELPEDTLLCAGGPYTAQLPPLPANAKIHLWNQTSTDSSYQQHAPAIIRLEVTDSNQCSNTDSMQLHSPSNSGYQWSLPDSLCRNESLTPGIVIASGHHNQQQSFELNGRTYTNWPANYRLRSDSLKAIWRIHYDSSTAMGCMAELQHTIYAHELPTFSLEVPKDTLCSSELPWQPTLAPKPQETTTIRWQMSTGTDSLQTPTTNPTEVYSSPQAVKAIAESRAGCIWTDSTRITIAYADQLSLNISPEPPNPNNLLPICKGEHISITATSRQNKAISWSVDDSYLEELNASPNSRTYRIRDSFGQTGIQIQTAGTAYCPPASLTQALQIHSYPKARILGLPAEDCEPLPLQLRSATDTAISTRWEQNGTRVSSTTEYNTSLNAGNYTIQLITEGTHCSDTATASLSIKPRPEIGIQIRPGREVYIDQPEINLRALFPFGGEPADHQIDWQLGDGNTGTGERISHRYRDTGQFTIVLSVSNKDNCNSKDSLNLRVWPKAFYLMPTAFSPNGDGINDRFSPEGNGISSWQMDIYTRWGERIYSGTEQDGGWDGNYRGAPAQTGTYSYYLKLQLATGEEQEEQGRVVLLR
jgi:gliding motility-associated-like protein